MSNFYGRIFFMCSLVCVSVVSYFKMSESERWVTGVISERMPAAVRQTHSSVLGQPLKLPSLVKSIEQISVTSNELTLPQFYISNGATYNWVCLDYSDVEVQLEGGGISSNSLKPSLNLQFSCDINPENPKFLKTVSFLWSEIKKQVEAGEEQFKLPGIQVRVSAVDKLLEGELPKMWRIKKIQFFNEELSFQEPVVITDKMLSQNLKSPLILRAL